MHVLLVLLVLPTLWAVGCAQGSNALDDCQPEDLRGSALQETTLDSGITCLYLDAGPCSYFTNNGSLYPDSSILCPAGTKGFGKAKLADSDILDDCPPEDLQGSALAKDARVSGSGLGCQYPNAGQCNYFSSNGSLMLGGILCPPTLKQTFTLSTRTSTTSPLPTSPGTSSLFGTSLHFSQTISIPQTSGASEVTTVRRGIPPGTLAGIVVLVAILLICFNVGMFWWCRHRRLQHRRREFPYKETIAPFNVGGPSGISNTSNEQQHLQTELFIATEKIVHLQDGENSTVAGPGGRSSIHGIWRQLSTRAASPRPPPDLEAQLHTAREQILMIAARMNALEAHADPALGMVGRHEAPPVYH